MGPGLQLCNFLHPSDIKSLYPSFPLSAVSPPKPAKHPFIVIEKTNQHDVIDMENIIPYTHSI